MVAASSRSGSDAGAGSRLDDLGRRSSFVGRTKPGKVAGGLINQDRGRCRADLQTMDTRHGGTRAFARMLACPPAAYQDCRAVGYFRTEVKTVHAAAQSGAGDAPARACQAAPAAPSNVRAKACVTCGRAMVLLAPFGSSGMALLASRRAFSRRAPCGLCLGSAISPARRWGLPGRIGCAAARRMRLTKRTARHYEAHEMSADSVGDAEIAKSTVALLVATRAHVDRLIGKKIIDVEQMRLTISARKKVIGALNKEWPHPTPNRQHVRLSTPGPASAVIPRRPGAPRRGLHRPPRTSHTPRRTSLSRCRSLVSAHQ
jgi:hypothetical protein